MSIPSLPVEEYRAKLKQTVAFPIFASIADDPGTTEDERRTWCNHFTRAVVRWFNFAKWKIPHVESGRRVDGERASDIVKWMQAHPEHWLDLRKPDGKIDFIGARNEALAGHCVIAGQFYVNTSTGTDPKKWVASGHVCPVAPEAAMHPSGTFGCEVPMVANVGGKVNEYGIPLSKAFKAPITGLFLLRSA